MIYKIKTSYKVIFEETIEAHEKAEAQRIAKSHAREKLKKYNNVFYAQGTKIIHCSVCHDTGIFIDDCAHCNGKGCGVCKNTGKIGMICSACEKERKQ